MTKIEAKNKVIVYLKERNIHFHDFVSDGEGNIVLVLPGYYKCPDSTLECSIYFFKSCIEARVYYTENASRWINDRPERLTDMYRLLNFINARVWPFTNDGIGGKLYLAHHLITPRFYITEDGHSDLTSTMVIDYDLFDMAPLEVCDTITASIPSLMDALSTPLFFVLLDKMNVDNAISYIKSEILEEESL